MPEGTLKPIMEELYASLEKDPVFEREDHPLRYFVKYQNEKYRISTSVSELSYEELKNTTYTINSRFFFDNNYYKLPMEAVKAAVIGNDESEQPKLLRLVKSLITEIVNLGYSVKYIQDIMTALFWNPQKQVDTPERINEFFEAFDFTRKEYTVVFVVNKLKISKLVLMRIWSLLKFYSRKPHVVLKNVF